MRGREANRAGLSLLFAAGKRPTVRDIERLLSSPDMSGAATQISYKPSEEEGWVELLATGLVFDLVGLSPAAPAPAPPLEHRFGVPDSAAKTGLEAITFVPGAHISTSLAMMPLVRAMVGLAANIALPFSVEGVCWHAAKSWMEPQYFSRVAFDWLAGGAFPALGLTSIVEQDDGSIATCGLDYLVGQEVHLEALPDEQMADKVKLAVRLADYMIKYGRIEEPRDLEGPDGEPLLAEPSQARDRVWIWRGS